MFGLSTMPAVVWRSSDNRPRQTFEEHGKIDPRPRHPYRTPPYGNGAPGSTSTIHRTTRRIVNGALIGGVLSRHRVLHLHRSVYLLGRAPGGTWNPAKTQPHHHVPHSSVVGSSTLSRSGPPGGVRPGSYEIYLTYQYPVI